MNPLQKALRINALFSGISGLSLCFLHQSFADIFNTTNTTVFWSVGIALIFFAGTIVYEINRQHPIAVLWIITQDILWVIGSAVLVGTDIFTLSSSGNSSITIVALIVLWMAWNQGKALARIDSTQYGRKQLRFERTVIATKQNVWKLIADVGNYHKVAPNIDTSKIISGKHEGMIRRCSHANDSWTETCTLWQEEEKYSFLVNTTAPDYPYPLQFLQGTWEVNEISPTTTSIVLLFEFQYNHSFQNWLIHPFLRINFLKVVEELLTNWQREAEATDL
jgi:ribosome-associated toxin RatA of RatAB toxin-antitoxin module